MKTVARHRKLSLSTRDPKSTSYKVDTEAVGSNDTFQLTVSDKDDGDKVIGVFEFDGCDVADRASIHFDARRVDGKWRLKFTGARPVAVTMGDDTI